MSSISVVKDLRVKQGSIFNQLFRELKECLDDAVVIDSICDDDIFVSPSFSEPEVSKVSRDLEQLTVLLDELNHLLIELANVKDFRVYLNALAQIQADAQGVFGSIERVLMYYAHLADQKYDGPREKAGFYFDALAELNKVLLCFLSFVMITSTSTRFSHFSINMNIIPMMKFKQKI